MFPSMKYNWNHVEKKDNFCGQNEYPIIFLEEDIFYCGVLEKKMFA